MQSWMVGFVSGIIAVGFSPQLPALSWVLSLAALAFGGCLYAARRLCHTRTLQALLWLFVGGLCCGCALGTAHGASMLQRRLPPHCVGEALVVTGEVTSLPASSTVHGVQRQRFELAVDTLTPDHCAGPATLMLSYYGVRRIRPGEHWQFEVKLKRPWGLANPGSFNMQAWYAQNHIDAVGSVRESPRTRKLPISARAGFSPDRIRQAISERIESQPLSPDVAAMLRALTIADGAAIDTQLWFLLQQYGLNHLLVVSGSHIAMFAVVGYILGGVCLRLVPRLAASRMPGGAKLVPGGFALLLAGVYTALAGFSIPTQRALCMLTCVVAANVAGRASSVASNLLAAAVVVLFLNPLAALSSGFWLSFGAVAGLLWVSRCRRGLSAGRQALWAHTGMALLMLPLGAYFFGGGSAIAMLANLLMVPLTGWWVVPVALLAAMCFLCAWPVDSTLWQWAGAPLEALLPPARALVQQAGDWLYIPLVATPGTMVLAVAGALIALLPGGLLRLPLAVLLALPLLLPQDLAATPPSLRTQVSILDVGQGTAVVVQSGARALLYDTGGGDPNGQNMAVRAVLPYLRRQGIRTLDTLVISHSDLDHSAGAAAVLDNFSVERLRYGSESPAPGKGRACRAGEAWRWPGGQTFEFLSPALETPPLSNDSSCVLRIQVGDRVLLLPGDIEQRREQQLVAYWGDTLRSDLLLVAHHGSRSSSTVAFLKHVRPGTAIVSSGYGNAFGHPHPLSLQRLQEQGAKILVTAADGAVEVALEPDGFLRTNPYRQQVRYYWM